MLYYDSTMAVLSPNYPGYEQVRYRYGKLKALADHRGTIRREDSLQHLAAMSPVERLKIVDVKIKELQRSEEHTSELQSIMRISYAVFCLKKKIHIYEI